MSDLANTLPDPLHAQAAGAGPTADEMLSQLAGDEIDRLLSEAETSRSEVAPVVASAAGEFQPPPASPQSEPAADPELNRQLDDLFNELTEDQAAPVVSETATEPAAEPTLPLAEVAHAAVASPADVTSSLESQVLAAGALTDIPEPPRAEREAKPISPAGESDAAEPFMSAILRPFVWLSTRFSDAALDWMGKVAILTTVNALAILAYILICRR